MQRLSRSYLFNAPMQQVGQITNTIERKRPNKTPPQIKQQINIKELPIIRIIINQGRGFGHQRSAITLMQKLRELEFRGEFDIHYDESYPLPFASNARNQSSGSNGRKIKILIPGFSAKPLNVLDEGQKIEHPVLGKMLVTRLPEIDSKTGSYQLSQVTLAMTSADDWCLLHHDTKAQLYNCDIYIGLQPTDWKRASRLISTKNKEFEFLASDLRLSSAYSAKKISVSEMKLSPHEKLVLELCTNPKLNTQLVYGLYPAEERDPALSIFKMQPTGSLEPEVECSRLIEAHQQLENCKLTVLFFPQEICKKLKNFFDRSFKNVTFIDLTIDESLKSLDIDKLPHDSIIVAYTGLLQPEFFDYVMLHGTTFPPIIEGCNSIEACEFSGRSFVHGGGKNAHLNEYKMDSKLVELQKLHVNASLCLQTGDPKYTNELAKYLSEATAGKLDEYHKARQKGFLQRPDACEFVFAKLAPKKEPLSGLLELLFTEHTSLHLLKI